MPKKPPKTPRPGKFGLSDATGITITTRPAPKAKRYRAPVVPIHLATHGCHPFIG